MVNLKLDNNISSFFISLTRPTLKRKYLILLILTWNSAANRLALRFHPELLWVNNRLNYNFFWIESFFSRQSWSTTIDCNYENYLKQRRKNNYFNLFINLANYRRRNKQAFLQANWQVKSLKSKRRSSETNQSLRKKPNPLRSRMRANLMIKRRIKKKLRLIMQRTDDNKCCYLHQ